MSIDNKSDTSHDVTEEEVTTFLMGITDDDMRFRGEAAVASYLQLFVDKRLFDLKSETLFASITPEMIREMESHLPFAIDNNLDQWQWCADYLNESLKNPNKVCDCCSVTRSGELMDHLPKKS